MRKVTVEGVASNGMNFNVGSGGSGGSGTVYYYLEDELGSSRTITDASGNVCYNPDLYPFGGEIVYTNTCPQNYKFTGKERDSESNLDYFEARYYASNMGRFMSPDPMNAGADPTNPQSWNMYSYALNNPLRFLDPTGLTVCDYGPNDDGTEDYEPADDDNECTSNDGSVVTFNQSIKVYSD